MSMAHANRRQRGQGRGFKPATVPNPIVDPEGVAEGRRAAGKRPGGYGIAMARAAMDEIFYNSAGNTVVLTKFLKRKKPGDAGPPPEARSPPPQA